MAPACVGPAVPNRRVRRERTRPEAPLALPPLPDYSFHNFDVEKAAEMRGAVKEFQWANPHRCLEVIVMAARPKMIAWSLKIGSRGAPPATVGDGKRFSQEIRSRLLPIHLPMDRGAQPRSVLL